MITRVVMLYLFWATSSSKEIMDKGITKKLPGFDATKSCKATTTGWSHCGLCHCCFVTEATYVHCSGPNITDIPATIPANVTHLTFTETSIEALTGDNTTTEYPGHSISRFHQYQRLKYLVFKSNAELKTISAGAFEFPGAGQGGITHLFITGSRKLKEVPAGALSNFKNLKSLRIKGCGLIKVPDWFMFNPGVNVWLTEIDLSDNKIEYLDKDSFSSLDAEVGTLSLEGNNIKSIADGAFFGTKIREIKLQNNTKLTKIGKSAFVNGSKNDSKLEVLDLSRTSIQTLPTNGLEKLESLILEDVWTLKVFPSVLKLLTVKEARLTYPHHCCAFAHPDKQNLEAWREFTERVERDCAAQDKDRILTTTPVFLLKEEIGSMWHNLMVDSPKWLFDENDSSAYDSLTYRHTKRSLTATLAKNGGFGKIGGSNGFGEEFKFSEIWHSTTINPNETITHIVLCGNVVNILKDTKCTPTPDAFNPCEDVMGSWILRIVVWFVAVCAMFGNLSVLLITFCSRQKITVQKLLMCNLAFSDFILGLYLLLLAVTDVTTIGHYFTYALLWQYDGGCQAAGFLAIFATNLSVFTLVVITMERWYAIRHAINLSKRLKLGRACVIMTGIWLYALLMACLPLVGISGYSKTSICLPMEAEEIADKLYLFFLLISNATAFIVICFCYIDMYMQVRGNKNAAGRNDANIAKKMAVLVFTDFICLFPIALFGLTAAAEKPLITVSESKILLVFFFPLNSCCNPFLYAIFTQQFRKDLFGLLSRCGLCEQRAARYRYTFSSNPISVSHSRNSLPGQMNNFVKGSNAHSPHQSSYKIAARGSEITLQTNCSVTRRSSPIIQLEHQRPSVHDPLLTKTTVETSFSENQTSDSLTTKTSELSAEEDVKQYSERNGNALCSEEGHHI